MYDKGTFSFVMPKDTYGIINWATNEYKMNPQDTYFPGNIVFNAQGKFFPKSYSTQKVYQVTNTNDIQNVISCLPSNEKLSVRSGGHEFNGASLIGTTIAFIHRNNNKKNTKEDPPLLYREQNPIIFLKLLIIIKNIFLK